MATPISTYQASMQAAKLAAVYSAAQSNRSSVAGSDAKTTTGASSDAGNGATANAQDAVILSLSAAAQQFFATQQQSSQPQSIPSQGNSSQDISSQSLAGYLNANDTGQSGGLIAGYSGAIQQFQSWLAQPLQVNVDAAKHQAEQAKAALEAQGATKTQGDAKTPGTAKETATETAHAKGTQPDMPVVTPARTKADNSAKA